MSLSRWARFCFALLRWTCSHLPILLAPFCHSLVEFINCPDTSVLEATALIEVCRSEVGYLQRRLDILKILIDNGGNALCKDSSGDNCFHWAVRKSALPIVKYILQCSDKAIFAALADNYKMRCVDVVVAMIVV